MIKLYNMLNYLNKLKGNNDTKVYVGVKIGSEIHLFDNTGDWGSICNEGKSTIFPYLFSLEVDFNNNTDENYYIYLIESKESFNWGYMDKNYFSEDRFKIFKTVIELIFNIENCKFYDKNSMGQRV